MSNILQAHWSTELELPLYFYKGKSFAAHFKDNPKPYADLFEALIGALFLDQGLGACKQMIARCLFSMKTEAPVMSVWLAEERSALEKDDTKRELLSKVTFSAYIHFRNCIVIIPGWMRAYTTRQGCSPSTVR